VAYTIVLMGMIPWSMMLIQKQRHAQYVVRQICTILLWADAQTVVKNVHFKRAVLKISDILFQEKF